jgi:hypothetical protein
MTEIAMSILVECEHAAMESALTAWWALLDLSGAGLTEWVVEPYLTYNTQAL